MRSLPILSLAGLFAIAATQPHDKRDDVVTVTSYTDVVKTVDVTKTVWVDETPAPPKHNPKRPSPVPHHEPKRPSPVPHHEPKRPSPVPPHQPKQPQPQPQSSAEAAPRPVHSHHDHHHMFHHHAPAPAPQPASSPAPAPSPAPSPNPAPSPKPAPSGNEPPASDVMSGDMTHYAPGLGSCGITSTEADNIVALAVPYMSNPINPNDNPLCGKTITISYQGAQHTAKIVDTCGGCADEDIDLTARQFAEIAPDGDGRVHNVKWWVNDY